MACQLEGEDEGGVTAADSFSEALTTAPHIDPWTVTEEEAERGE